MFEKKHVQKMIKEATGLTAGVDEPFRSLAFSAIFAEMLRSPRQGGEHEVQSVPSKEPEPLQVSSKDKDRLTTMLRSNFDWSTLPVASKDALVQNLMILKLALDRFKIDGLSAKEVQQILFQKYRISKTPNAVSMSLMAAVGKYVDRIQEGKEFLYRITQKGIARLAEGKSEK